MLAAIDKSSDRALVEIIRHGPVGVVGVMGVVIEEVEEMRRLIAEDRRVAGDVGLEVHRLGRSARGLGRIVRLLDVAIVVHRLGAPGRQAVEIMFVAQADDVPVVVSVHPDLVGTLRRGAFSIDGVGRQGRAGDRGAERRVQSRLIGAAIALLKGIERILGEVLAPAHVAEPIVLHELQDHPVGRGRRPGSKKIERLGVIIGVIDVAVAPRVGREHR